MANLQKKARRAKPAPQQADEAPSDLELQRRANLTWDAALAHYQQVAHAVAAMADAGDLDVAQMSGCRALRLQAEALTKLQGSLRAGVDVVSIQPDDTGEQGPVEVRIVDVTPATVEAERVAAAARQEGDHD